MSNLIIALQVCLIMRALGVACSLCFNIGEKLDLALTTKVLRYRRVVHYCLSNGLLFTLS